MNQTCSGVSYFSSLSTDLVLNGPCTYGTCADLHKTINHWHKHTWYLKIWNKHVLTFPECITNAISPILLDYIESILLQSPQYRRHIHFLLYTIRYLEKVCIHHELSNYNFLTPSIIMSIEMGNVHHQRKRVVSPFPRRKDEWVWLVQRDDEWGKER